MQEAPKNGKWASIRVIVLGLLVDGEIYGKPPTNRLCLTLLLTQLTRSFVASSLYRMNHKIIKVTTWLMRSKSVFAPEDFKDLNYSSSGG
jgi:hypothetical protein